LLKHREPTQRDFIIQLYEKYRSAVNDGDDPFVTLNRLFANIRKQAYANFYRKPIPGDYTDPRNTATAHEILWSLMIDQAHEDKAIIDEKRRIEEEKKKRIQAGEVEDTEVFHREQVDFLSQARRHFRDRIIIGFSANKSADSVLDEIIFG